MPSRQLDLTTGLDVAAVSLIAAGLGGGLWQFIGPFGLVASGLTVLGSTWIAARAR